MAQGINRLGVITDGISRDFETALQVMQQTEISYAELQFLWDKEIGDLDEGELEKAQGLLKQYGKQVSCISRHNFVGLPVLQTTAESEAYKKHCAGLQRCIQAAKFFDTRLVRIMSCRKEMILFGYDGADAWMATKGAWDALLRLMEKPVQLAQDEGITLVVETGNNALVNSAAMARHLIEDLGTGVLKVLWDPANALFANECPYPDGYEEIKEHLAHLHIKDSVVDIRRASVRCCPLGTGDMAPYLEKIAQALQRDNYQGTVSLESVYIPADKTSLDGYYASVEKFKTLFGSL